MADAENAIARKVISKVMTVGVGGLPRNQAAALASKLRCKLSSWKTAEHSDSILSACVTTDSSKVYTRFVDGLSPLMLVSS